MQRAFNQVYCVDCMEFLKKIPDKYYDLAVVDPPYFTGPEKREFYGSSISKTGVHRKSYPVWNQKWVPPGEDYFKELLRVCSHYIVWGEQYFSYRLAPGRIIWDKCNGSSTFSDCEIAATNIHNSVRLWRYVWNGMMQGKNMHEGHIVRGDKSLNDIRIHPTQKPIDLYRWIFSQYARPGIRVLDTHVGSGTIRCAAWEYGLHFEGCEINQEMFDLQEAFFKTHCAQQRFDF